ncbi:MAG TPA: 16S rRNA (cytidine(1402)-2'-O)-methyltransferase [Candidatus Avacidaminococcus intestinavium]|uniref:Ribosomal RNA small subunit methyltransferase I n=1 Tax=Candidatus Avacidaminococcus intestinavium TaxID=2840684 RepID=A0A9D1MQN2_9FIRM|nr:16S rRNA (cytidine(1402)-2'-O)-methyltransferase [Candidatus Avacidaminococcus intestinavium]
MCATPIGNLGDITKRALTVLSEVDLIAAEDTRRTRQLLNHFAIKKPLVSYHEHNKEKQGLKLLEELRKGYHIALVSDAGFPGIADPGEQLVNQAVKEGITVVPLPGANAALSALVASGLPSAPFFFGGFLPKNKKHRKEQLVQWQHIPSTIVLYEAPHRVKEVIKDILAVWGERQIALARELTKVHEEFFRGTLAEALAHLELQQPRGEFTLVIAQGTKIVELREEDPLSVVQKLLAEGKDKKETLQSVAKAYKIPKRDLYNRLILLEEGDK